MSAQVDPLIGQIIQDRYRIGRVLGAGGMGKVYLAEQLDLERPVAFKVLLPQFAHDKEFLLRFRREARQLAALKDHSRVVDIYGSGELPDGGLFIVMEYIEGPTLQEVIKTTGALLLNRAVSLGIQIAEGLREAHRVNIVHRDIKPTNIKVWESADGEALKILDFGIAQAVNPETWMQITHTNVIIGSPKYMAPETIREGKYSERSDLYAWGVVLYEMLCGQPPFIAQTADAVKYKHVNEPPIPLRELRSDVPIALEDVVMNALAKDSTQRPANMQAVITALRTVDLTTRYEPTAPTIILNDQESRVQKLQPMESQSPSSLPIHLEAEKKSEIPVNVPPPDMLQVQKPHRMQIDLRLLGFSLAAVVVGMIVFASLPITRETGSVLKRKQTTSSINSGNGNIPSPEQPPAAPQLASHEPDLIDVVSQGNLQETQRLLDAGAQPNVPDERGWTALMMATLYDHTSVVQLLLKKGATVNVSNSTGGTALMMAALQGQDSILQLLLDNGASVNTQDAKGWTALMYAARNGYASTVEVLLSRGAEVNLKNDEGRTALLMATAKGHQKVVRVLQDKKARGD